MKQKQRIRLCNRAVAGAILALLVASVAPLRALSLAEWRYRQMLEVQAAGLMRVDLPPATLNSARPDRKSTRLNSSHSS